MPRNIKVTYKYLYRSPIKRMVGYDVLIGEIVKTRAASLQQWLDSDTLFEPTSDFKITKLELNNDKQIVSIELTETENY